jgi:hypothetical protein
MPGFFGEASIASATSFWIAARMTAAIGLLIAGFIKQNRTVKTASLYFCCISLLIQRCDGVYYFTVSGIPSTLVYGRSGFDFFEGQPGIYHYSFADYQYVFILSNI